MFAIFTCCFWWWLCFLVLICFSWSVRLSFLSFFEFFVVFFVLVLTGGYNLICSGYGSCEQTTIQWMTNIYSTAYYAMIDANIGNTTGDVYCVTNGACYGATFYEIGGNVYGFGNSAIYDGVLSNNIDETIIEEIYLIGTSAGSDITINNVKQLFASGTTVLYNAVVTGNCTYISVYFVCNCVSVSVVRLFV